MKGSHSVISAEDHQRSRDPSANDGTRVATMGHVQTHEATYLSHTCTSLDLHACYAYAHDT